MKKHVLPPWTALVLLLAVVACKHDPQGMDQQPSMSYKTDIQPILANCTSCHEHRSGGDIDLSHYQGVLEQVQPGDPSGSKLYRALVGKLAPIMPPSPAQPLGANQRTQVYLWIWQGAKE